jgi:hypothetical protein
MIRSREEESRPRPHPIPPAAPAAPRPRWFERARKWRIGCEGRISALERRLGLRRCRHKGLRGMHRWVGMAVIANNLLVLGRTALPGKKRRIL